MNRLFHESDILTVIKKKALESKKSLLQAAHAHGRDIKIYLHWSAGTYDQVFNDYHINIQGDGTIYCTNKSLGFAEQKDHTFSRNPGAIGVALCCCGGNFGQNGSMGPYPPTKIQIETMAKVTCILADTLGLPIDIYHIMTHGEAGDNEDGIHPHDSYGPKAPTCERVDLEWLTNDQFKQFYQTAQLAKSGDRGGDILRRKIKWYHDQGLTKLY